MDVFLIRNGVVQNIICIESLEYAQALFPDLIAIQRTEENQHIQIGDAWV